VSMPIVVECQWCKNKARTEGQLMRRFTEKERPIGWVLIGIATSLTVCLAGCSDTALKQKVADLEKENAELKKKLEDKSHPSIANEPSLPKEEALDYLDGKPLPLPDDGGPYSGKDVVIQRSGVRQLVPEGSSSSSLDGYKDKTYEYSLVYDTGKARYFAEVLITVRQVGEQRICTAVQVMRSRKITEKIDTKPN
jgi:hypothetical protein